MAAAVLAAAFLFLLLPLPQRPLVFSNAQSLTATGAFHVHTDRSDGSGTPDEVAAAAARAGLNFIVLTDHGDGTRQPDPPQYRSGVLVIDGVELSTQGGHYIAVGMAQAPYPLRGQARDVVEDVRRLGGFGVVAHPDSAKPELRWSAWNVPFDGIEWLNADTEWRDESRVQFARALARYFFRPAETLASLLDRPDRTLERWDTLTKTRPVVALAGADAHARAGWMEDEPNGYRRGWFLRVPSYDASFRAFGIRVAVEQPLGKDAAADAQAVLSALRTGRVYSAIDALATPPVLEFTLKDSLFVARTNAPGGGTIVLRRDGRIVSQQSVPELTFDSKGEQGSYRVEVHLSNAPGDPPVPWIVSNPIYVHPDGWGVAPAAAEPLPPTISLSIQGGPWHTETDDTTTARVLQPQPPNGPAVFSYRLGAGDRAGQYAALVIGVGTALTERRHLAVRAQASHAMRVSVQARHPQSGERWERSIYVDAEARDIIIPFSDMSPVGTSGAFDPGRADTVMFVVDLTNANPGSAGEITIHDLRIER